MEQRGTSMEGGLHRGGLVSHTMHTTMQRGWTASLMYRCATSIQQVYHHSAIRVPPVPSTYPLVLCCVAHTVEGYHRCATQVHQHGALSKMHYKG